MGTAETTGTDVQIVVNAAPTTWDEVRVSVVRALHRIAVKEGYSALAAHCERALETGTLHKDSLSVVAKAINALARITKIPRPPEKPPRPIKVLVYKNGELHNDLSKPPAPNVEGATPCSFDEVEPGDFVKVGGVHKEVHAVIGETDVETTDARIYSRCSLQGFMKRKKA